MKQQEVFRKTGAIIKELLDQYEYLQETADNLNDLELELFVANTHFLKDHAEILKKLNLQRSQEQKALPPPAAEEKPAQQAPVEAELMAPLPAIPLPPKTEPVATEIPQPEQISRFNLPKPDFFRPQAPKVEQPKPEQIAPPTARPAGEPKYFEPMVQPVKPVAERVPFITPQLAVPEVIKPEVIEDKPAPSINQDAGRDVDTYSFQREETGTIKHTLEVNEADIFEEEATAPVTIHTTLATQVPVTLETLLDDNSKADETERPNIVPTNPEPVIDNTPKTAAEQTAPLQQPEVSPEPAAPVSQEPAKEERPLTLNERLRAQQSGTSAPAYVKEELPITDLKSAISLNDKLLFVKDLFNGYSLAYSEAIEIVNRFSNFEEADRFLKTNYVTKNNWAGKQATADKFYSLLKRRYA